MRNTSPRTAIVLGATGLMGATILLRPAVSQVGVTPAYVRLQNATPGIAQTGHSNITGTQIAGAFKGNGSQLLNLTPGALSQAGATIGQALKWNGSIWAPGNDNGGLASVIHDSTLTGDGTSVLPLGVAIPLTLTGTTPLGTSILTCNNLGAGTAVIGRHTLTGSFGVLGDDTSGVYGETGVTGGRAVFGAATGSIGPSYGIYGRSDSTSGIGVYGSATFGSGKTYGVFGFNNNMAGIGVYGLLGAKPSQDPEIGAVTGESISANGVSGWSDEKDGVHGASAKYGTFDSQNFRGGVHGVAAGLLSSPDNFGVVGTVTAYGTGVLGVGKQHGHGVVGVGGVETTKTTVGVLGLTQEDASGQAGWPPKSGLNLTTFKGMVGVLGQAVNTVGVWGESSSRIGVVGTVGNQLQRTELPSGKFGVFGHNTDPSGSAIYGLYPATNSWGSIGIAGVGVRGQTGTGPPASLGELGSGPNGVKGQGMFGVEAIGTNLAGVFAHSTVSPYTAFLASTSAAVSGSGTNTNGHIASSSYGVFGEATGSSPVAALFQTPATYSYNATGTIGVMTLGVDYGVQASATAVAGYALYGNALGGSGVGLYATGASAAGVFSGTVAVFGDFSASGVKAFKIDHPLYPEAKVLYHYCTESPEPQNTYRGRVRLDSNGSAIIRLPDYFEAINKDPDYALTPVGDAMPNLHVSAEVRHNAFGIAGGMPGGTVSWHVTATRNDKWVQAHGAPTEVEKSAAERGRYISPELYGAAKETGLGYAKPGQRPMK
ncbi:MAG: hypothetical protein JSS66_01680 [Armatimonadetes bacterium]|nr:hypothetical protein [Armatimonadota bacterium]